MLKNKQKIEEKEKMLQLIEQAENLNCDNSISLDEYIKKSKIKDKNPATSLFITIFISALVIIAFASLCSFSLKMYEINDILGYVTMGVMFLIFVIFILVPLIKIRQKPSFILNVSSDSLSKSKVHNRKVLLKIANNIVEIADEVKENDNKKWYSSENITNLKMAIKSKSYKELKDAIYTIYNVDLKKATAKIILKYSKNVALSTMLSPAKILDTALVMSYNLGLIKNIVYLYGFKPTDEKMLQIYFRVIVNSLSAYGLQGSTSGLFDKLLGAIPFVGDVISKVAGLVTEGLANATLTYLIGKKVKNVLQKEYNLQSLLDSVDDKINEKEFELFIKSVNDETQIKLNKSKKTKQSNGDFEENERINEEIKSSNKLFGFFKSKKVETQ